jgi:DNA-binding MarR family transcriptional regulator
MSTATKDSETKRTDLGVLYGTVYDGQNSNYLRWPVDANAWLSRLGLTSTEILLVQAIQSHRREKTPDACPALALETLAAESGAHQVSVSKMVKKLEAINLIKIEHGSKGRGHANTYDLRPLWKKLAELVEAERNQAAQLTPNAMQ